MSKVTPTALNFVERAQQLGRKFKSIPLKDGSAAKLSWNDNACDCVIVKNNKITGGRGAAGRPEHVENELAVILDKLKKFVLPGNEVKL